MRVPGVARCGEAGDNTSVCIRCGEVGDKLPCAPGVGRWEIMLLLEQKEGRSRAERLWAPWPQGLGGIPLLC